MSLYSKYRPQNFGNLVGQEHVRQTILNEITTARLTHAYLFAGPRGTGKTSTARLIAKSLNCTNLKNGEPCDSCDMCVGIRDGNLIDVVEIDAASNRGIDEIRDLKEKIGYAPSLAKTKTYIIDEVHMLTKEAFNALLKTLEEPPESVYFILCTTEIHKIPETIISRCQRFDFKRIDSRTILTRLSFIAQAEGIEAEDEALEMVARHVEGGLRDAIGLFEQLSIDKKLTTEHVKSHLGITGHQTIKKCIEHLSARDTQAALGIIAEVHREGYDLTSFTREILEGLREKLLAEVKSGTENAGQWIRMIETFERSREMLRTTVIPQLPLEVAVIKICENSDALVMQTQNRSVSATAPMKVVTHTTPTAKIGAPPAHIEGLKAVEEEQTQGERATVTIIKDELEMERYKVAGAVTQNWQRVVEHVNPPSLRRSLTQCTVQEAEGNKLVLIFTTEFHMSKVNGLEAKSKISQALEHIFSRKMEITCELRLAAGMQDESLKHGDIAESKPKSSAQKTIKGSEDLAAKALEIFGDDGF